MNKPKIFFLWIEQIQKPEVTAAYSNRDGRKNELFKRSRHDDLS